jgi:hypothetical protein
MDLAAGQTGADGGRDKLEESPGRGRRSRRHTASSGAVASLVFVLAVSHNAGVDVVLADDRQV